MDSPSMMWCQHNTQPPKKATACAPIYITSIYSVLLSFYLLPQKPLQKKNKEFDLFLTKAFCFSRVLPNKLVSYTYGCFLYCIRIFFFDILEVVFTALTHLRAQNQ